MTMKEADIVCCCCHTATRAAASRFTHPGLPPRGAQYMDYATDLVRRCAPRLMPCIQGMRPTPAGNAQAVLPSASHSKLLHVQPPFPSAEGGRVSWATWTRMRRRSRAHRPAAVQERAPARHPPCCRGGRGRACFQLNNQVI